MGKKVSIGIIGAGWIVENVHIPALLKMKNVNIIAIYDIDKSRARSLCTTFNIINACDNLEEFYLLGIDGVIIATPNFTHVEYTLKMLEHGIHVLCEKPVAFHANDVKEIIQVSKKHNALYIPGFVNRWRLDIQKIYHIIHSGKIGEIKSVNAGWLRKCGVPRPGTWFTNKELSGGGVLIDLGSHVLDICLMFLKNKKPIEYELETVLYNTDKKETSSAADWFKSDYVSEFEINVEDTAIATVYFDDGAVLNVNLSWVAPIEGDCTYFNIVGSKGKISLKTLFGFSNERLWQEDSLQIECDGIKTFEKLDRTHNHSRLAFEGMIEYFIGAIISKEVSFTNSDDALKTVDMIEKLYHINKVSLNTINHIGLKGLASE